MRLTVSPLRGSFVAPQGTALRSDRRGDRGAVATIVAVLLAGGVVMGMLAVSVDLGNIMYERSQVQNAADATSLALAQECADDAASCTATAVEDLLGANARDAASRYSSTEYPAGACAHGTTEQVGSVLDPCTTPGDMADLGACPPLPDGLDPAVPYVETYAATETTTGDDELFLPFSRVLAGGEAGDVGVSACARAAWGPVGSTGSTMPITIGACDWANKTSDGGVPGEKYAPSPPYAPAGNSSSPPPVPDVIADGGYATGIFLHDSGDHECTGSPGAEYPGGFGWLMGTDCEATVVDGWIEGSTGASGSKTGCTPELMKDYIGTEVFIPIFEEVTGTGSSGKYRISGVASFYLAGWNGMSAAAPDKSYGIYEEPDGVCTGKCNASVSYVWGWFTSSAKPVDSVDFGTVDRGAHTIKPIG